ncbi:unnamed protein product [Spirodela intermedia]|uniref:Bifunctional inhibitor/plant lipid transfer protein/seed storage helical domain-containing protein n=1 Tax=Spirodela intermedia TaxID=51605 RepID=A0A7I8KQG4_SPIIN|nr:unnamed protein product [Spirodela intermedia]
MGRTAVVLVLVAAVAAALWTGVAAQSSCNSVILSLVPCVLYIGGSSSTPSAQCCTQLASVVKSQPECLCSVLSGSAGVSTTVNQTRALALPGACNVQTPSASLCSAPPPSSTPAAPPTAPPPSRPAPPHIPPPSSGPATASTPPADGGTKATPPGGDPSSGNSNRMTFAVFFCTLFAAAF